MIRTYELMFALKTSVGEEAMNAEFARIKGVVEQGGTIVSENVIGKRRLAYEIKDEKDGYYVVLNFEAAPEFPKEISRILGISDLVLRHMITCPEVEVTK